MKNLRNDLIGPAKRPVPIRIYELPDPKGVVIIAPAMGVLQGFYKDIAAFLNNAGFAVIAFDYFGMTMHHPPRAVKDNSISRFGMDDLDVVIRYARDTFQDLSLFFVGHSVAGQVFPLAEHAQEVKAAVLIGSQQVSEHLWSGRYKVQVQLFWRLFIPTAVGLYGHLPGFVYGGKHPLQKAIAVDWARLALTKSGMYGENEATRLRYESLTMPVTFISLEGDHLLAPRSAVEALMGQYGSPSKNHIHVVMGRSVRNPHFEFFRKTSEEYWELVTSALSQ